VLAKRSEGRSKKTSNTVNIDSRRVVLVNSARPNPGMDLECTCIEVDGISLVHLIYNFRDLIKQKGKTATLPPEEALNILGVMIEDARRLLLRSPILTRVPQRIVIQKSLNTRYGMDTGTRFYTYTTSKGISAMIHQAGGYYSALQMYGKAEMYIRPKFLQMLVFLVSLLNDTDLEKLRPVLEQTFNLKADRQSIELTIMKTFTSWAVSPNLFLTGVLSAFRMTPVNIEDRKQERVKAWSEFLGGAARLGWLLPCTMEQKTNEAGSWKMKWDEYKSTDIFDHLQYCGEKRAVNEIPPLKIQSGQFASMQVSVDFVNNQTYLVDAEKLDSITLAMPGTYIITDPDTKHQYDLKVVYEPLFLQLDQIYVDLENIAGFYNQFISQFEGKPQRGSKFWDRLRLKSRHHFHFAVTKPAGSRTRHITSIVDNSNNTETTIAICYKLDGRTLDFSNFLDGVTGDINALNYTIRKLDDFQKHLKEQKTRKDDHAKKMVEKLDGNLQLVFQKLQNVDEERKLMRAKRDGKGDEPIIRVHFPSHIHFKQDQAWRDFTQTISPDLSRLAVCSERYKITETPKWANNVVKMELGNDGWIFMATTFSTDVPETEEQRNEEVCKGDSVLLLGGLVVVVGTPQLPTGSMVTPNTTSATSTSETLEVLNYLKLSAVEREAGNEPRRRRGGGIRPPKLEQSVLF
jgi:hypothetical protein